MQSVFFNHNTFFLIVTQVVLNLFLISLWQNHKLLKFHNIYQAEQKIHEGFVPRMGGFVMLTSLYIFLGVADFFQGKLMLAQIITLMTPILLITFLEDLYNNILALARLVFMFISTAFLLWFVDFELPVINIPGLQDFFLTHAWLLAILLMIALAAITNAFNWVDGANGLLLSNFFLIALCLNHMAQSVFDEQLIDITSLIMILSLVQLLFNFPRARMFAGDLGAYSIGLLLSFLVVIFFGRHSQFLSWQAIMILFYPTMEMLFTLSRRLYNKTGIMVADRNHLHQLIFQCINQYQYLNSIQANALTTVLLIPLVSLPCIWIVWLGPELNLIQVMSGIVFNATLYLAYYLVFFKLNEKLQHSPT